MLDITPIGARLIIKRDETPDKIGRIYIPKASQEMVSWEGQVMAVGSECTQVKAGDKVFYGRYAGYNFERGEGRETFTFLNEEDILGIVSTNGGAGGDTCQTPKL